MVKRDHASRSSDGGPGRRFAAQRGPRTRRPDRVRPPARRARRKRPAPRPADRGGRAAPAPLRPQERLSRDRRTAPRPPHSGAPDRVEALFHPVRGRPRAGVRRPSPARRPLGALRRPARSEPARRVRGGPGRPLPRPDRFPRERRVAEGGNPASGDGPVRGRRPLRRVHPPGGGAGGRGRPRRLGLEAPLPDAARRAQRTPYGSAGPSRRRRIRTRCASASCTGSSR